MLEAFETSELLCYIPARRKMIGEDRTCSKDCIEAFEYLCDLVEQWAELDDVFTNMVEEV